MESMGYQPTPKTKRRIVHKDDNRKGVVLEDDGLGSLLIHWGTTSYPNARGETVTKMITEWVPCHDVVTEEEPVYYGDAETGVKSMVYNPEEHL